MLFQKIFALQKEAIMPKEILVKRYIEQIKDGLHYRGKLTLGGIVLEYEIIFTVHIKNTGYSTSAKDPSAIRERYPISIKRNGSKIELNDNELFVFFYLIVFFAVEFYCSPEVVELNASNIEDKLKVDPKTVNLVNSTLICCEDETTLSVSTQVFKILQNPKFGFIFSN